MAEAVEEEEKQDESADAESRAEPEVTSALQERFEEEGLDRLQDELGLDNPMAVPRLKKITVNMGLGDISEQRDKVDWAREDLARITGQQPVITRARKSIAGFNIRKGDPVGVKVTLRDARMYAFLNRLITVVIPRIKDFSGLDTDSLDGDGNFSMGIDEQVTFPGISADSVEDVQGMDITITTTADSDRAGLALLKELGMPFREEES